MATWPTTLPQEFPEDGFNLVLADNVIRSSMDIGPAKIRRRTTSNVTKLTGTLILDTTQLTAFETFYITTISYGSVYFTWVHPLTNASCTMRFTEPPSYTPAGGSYTRVDMKLEILA